MNRRSTAARAAGSIFSNVIAALVATFSSLLSSSAAMAGTAGSAPAPSVGLACGHVDCNEMS